ncbi:MAG: hypothetical protein HDR10_01650 [Lachnospiraceae bacterium]|nr:hypothetical protein [Lachnospiraceae bacterium]
MRQEVRDHLMEEYNNLEFRRQFTAIKYRFRYNNVDVNIYFDAYDDKAPSMSMILAYDRVYYYTSLNINNTEVRTEYLEKIPFAILNQILDGSHHLISFFAEIEKHILENNRIVINYEKDTCFINTMKYSRLRTDLPFLQSLRKVNMPDDTLERLSETMGIDREILKKIQSEGFTIVRTDDIKKRKHLTAIIENAGISI